VFICLKYYRVILTLLVLIYIRLDYFDLFQQDYIDIHL